MRARMELGGYAQSSIISYIRPVRDLMEALGKVPENISEPEVIRHLNHYRETKNISPSALNTRVYGITYYYHNVLKESHLRFNIPNPGRITNIGEVLTMQEVSILLGACYYLKQAAVLHILYDTGIRAREVANLRIRDFNKETGMLRINCSKGGKHRMVPYGEAVKEALTAYFLIEKPTDWLFEGNTKGEPMGTKAVQYMVREALKRTAIRKDVHPHTIRHTFAVHYINEGGSLLRLQQILGHVSMSSTLGYLRFASIPLHEIDTPLDTLRGKTRHKK